MADKLGRNYILQVEGADGRPITVQPPFTIEFDITRNILTSANVCSIRVYNLNKNNRSLLRFNIMDSDDFRFVQLRAGYKNNLSTIFVGNITQAWSVREGVNFITSIECFDGGFAFNNSEFNQTFKKGTSYKAIIEAIINTLDEFGIQPGAIGTYSKTLSKDTPFSGTATTLLTDLTQGGFFIDNGKANCLGNSEFRTGGIPLINAKSGLLGTPVRERNIITFDMLFEAGIIAGQKVQLESLTESSFNTPSTQSYKVISVKHRGMISESVCGDAVTTLGMYFGEAGLSEVRDE